VRFSGDSVLSSMELMGLGISGVMDLEIDFWMFSVYGFSLELVEVGS
jgi:hypothetical protein